MATPDGHRPTKLSTDEQQRLDRIAEDLAASDRGFSHTMARLGRKAPQTPGMTVWRGLQIGACLAVFLSVAAVVMMIAL